jgi:hypothetical protein
LVGGGGERSNGSGERAESSSEHGPVGIWESEGDLPSAGFFLLFLFRRPCSSGMRSRRRHSRECSCVIPSDTGRDIAMVCTSTQRLVRNEAERVYRIE